MAAFPGFENRMFPVANPGLRPPAKPELITRPGGAFASRRCRALAALAEEMAVNPRNMLQRLVEVAVDLCQADTSGISLLEGEVFRWEAVAGVFADARNGTMPRDASPCGVVIDRDAIQLMELPDRGDLVWMLFSPHAGSEQAGRRPGIVLSPRLFHEHSRLAMVCPITSRERGWRTEVKLPPGLPVSGVILVDHLRSLDREARKLEIVGRAPEALLEAIKARLAPLLGF